ncbi:MAG: propanediol utilization protein [Rhodobacteraceae bacterium]|nr:propanediol utilization protein [Paracoccaceae bacterium]
MVFVAGHFGEWIQGLARPLSEVALVTLFCPERGVSVIWDDAPEFAIADPAGLVDRARAEVFLRAVGRPVRGKITVTPDLPPGGGAGISTAAFVALARAVCAPEDRIAPACLLVEGAVDPLMLARPDSVLWASRSARVLDRMPPPPRAEIVAGFFGLPERTDPADRRFPRADDLFADWVRGPDLPVAARLASLSATRCTALRGPQDDPTPALAARLGALGWARAHTGSARALIFPPGGAPGGAETTLSDAGFAHVLRFATGGRT